MKICPLSFPHMKDRPYLRVIQQNQQHSQKFHSWTNRKKDYGLTWQIGWTIQGKWPKNSPSKSSKNFLKLIRIWISFPNWQILKASELKIRQNTLRGLRGASISNVIPDGFNFLRQAARTACSPAGCTEWAGSFWTSTRQVSFQSPSSSVSSRSPTPSTSVLATVWLGSTSWAAKGSDHTNHQHYIRMASTGWFFFFFWGECTRFCGSIRREL